MTTSRVADLLAAGAQALEVLPPSAYGLEHLPGAVNVPLPELTRERALRDLDPARPVVVYCYDTECDLSARGAALLCRYGFAEVYDYTGSKTEWLATGHAAEGSTPAGTRAGAVARPAVTVGPDASLSSLPHAGPGGVVVVVDDDGRVLGAVRPVAGGDVRVLDVLQPGPPTVRPSITASELARSMDDDGQRHVLVTTLDGVLVGVVVREDLGLDA